MKRTRTDSEPTRARTAQVVRGTIHQSSVLPTLQAQDMPVLGIGTRSETTRPLPLQLATPAAHPEPKPSAGPHLQPMLHPGQQVSLSSLPREVITLILMQYARRGIDPTTPQVLIEALRDFSRLNTAFLGHCQELISSQPDTWKFEAARIEWSSRERLGMSLPLSSVARHWQLDLAFEQALLDKALVLHDSIFDKVDRAMVWTLTEWPLNTDSDAEYREADWREVIASWPYNLRNLIFRPRRSCRPPEAATVELLKTCTALRSVTVEYAYDLLENPSVDLAWLEQLPRLERLQWDARIPLDSIPQGVRGKLKSLRLKNACQVNDEKFPEWMCKLPELELEISSDIPDVEEFRLPANLSILEISGVGALQSLPPAIKMLRLHNCDTEVCEQVLMTELSGLIDLAVLHSEVVSEGVPFPWNALIKRLQQPQCKLQSLALHDVPEEDDVYIALCGALKTIQSLQKLTLDISRGMNDERMTCVSDTLPHLHSLQMLSLKVGVLEFGPCIPGFLKAIKSCTTLRKLDLKLSQRHAHRKKLLLEKQLEAIRKEINPLIELTIMRPDD